MRDVLGGDGVVPGWGTNNGRQVYVFSQDFTAFGGSRPKPMPAPLPRCAASKRRPTGKTTTRFRYSMPL
jgi:hypothetical protein